MKNIEDILKAYKAGSLDAKAAEAEISNLSLRNIGHTRIDMERRTRTGVGEIIFGAGKTPQQILEISQKLRDAGERVLVTRLSDESSALLLKFFKDAEFNESAKCIAIGGAPETIYDSHIAIVSAGTSDMPVAEEAKFTAEFLGSRTRTYYDCGVAGLHRLASVIDEIRLAKVVVAVAGMEGALASVLAGLLKAPLIAVPTSVGYGANFGGITALLAMMNSCANGISVVNIDNGFGAGYNAHLINSIGQK